MSQLGVADILERFGALEAEGWLQDLFQNLFVSLFWYTIMIGIIRSISGRWGRGRKGKEDSAVGTALGRGQLTKADRGRSDMHGVGTQRR